MIKKLFSGSFLSALLFLPVAYAAHRHHNAHVHGHGQLNIAIDNRVLHIELKMPAQDILGFENVTTNAQRVAVRKAIDDLKSKDLWILPEKSQCSLIQLSVKTSKHHQHVDKGKHASDHMDIYASYTYKCHNPNALNTLGTTLFEYFLGSQKISVQSVTARGQRIGVLTPEKRGMEI